MLALLKSPWTRHASFWKKFVSVFWHVWFFFHLPCFSNRHRRNVGHYSPSYGMVCWSGSKIDTANIHASSTDEIILQTEKKGCFISLQYAWFVLCTAWCNEIGSLMLLDAPELHASSEVREPISLHQAEWSHEDCEDEVYIAVYWHNSS